MKNMDFDKLKSQAKDKFGELLAGMSNELNQERFSMFSKIQTDYYRDIGDADCYWTIRGIIDIHGHVYPISGDTKLVSKILESQLFPIFQTFADRYNLKLELASRQNWYPDMTFILKTDERVKFAVDLKSTYRDLNRPEFCNGFTLGSYKGYFRNRIDKKNIQYPYNEYAGHFCFCVIYDRCDLTDETKIYSVKTLPLPPIKNLIFFAHEKWKIAGKTPGSGNTANIGSIKDIDDLYYGRNGAFSSEKEFDDYWMSYGG